MFQDFINFYGILQDFIFIFKARQQSCGKVMFSVLSVCLFVHGGHHVTITYNALDLMPQSQPPLNSAMPLC